MKVYKIAPRGYCKGVVSAIKMAKDTVNEHKNCNVYILGMIVHNQYIVDALKNIGVITIEDKSKSRMELLDSINDGIVIITAHGASDEVFAKARSKGLIIKDATCIDVIKTHNLIKDSITNGYHILYIGKAGHPESEGTISIDKENITLIESINDIDKLPKKGYKYLITNQTTMSILDIFRICEYAKGNLDNVEVAQETCNATRMRQEAITNLPPEIDIVLVVGDPNSNNSTRLVSIANQQGVESHLIESINDININWFTNKNLIGVTAGASTPTYLTNSVISYLEQLDLADYKTINNTPVIDMNMILK